MSILCIGEMLIDFTPVSDMKNSYTANPGGAPANVAVSAARNGIKAGFLGKLGNDDFGRMLVNTLNQNEVILLSPELTDEATTTLAFLTLDENGDRSFTFARKPGADLLLSKEDVNKVDITEWDIVHVGSVSQSGAPEKDAVLLAVKKAKEAGKTVSFDINYRENIWTSDECLKESEKIFTYTDFLKISEEELMFVGGEDNIPAFMKEYSITVLVLTRGSAGASIYYKDEHIKIAPMKAKAVDSTGAGDAFWGGFLSCLLNEGVKTTEDITSDKLNKAGEWGAVSGGLCIQKQGGIPALPYKYEIAKALNNG